MVHLSEQQLADLFRGLGRPEISEGIRAHFAQGCSKCETARDAWSRVRRFATGEAAYAPPENLVRLVKQGFASNSAPRAQAWTLASLVFDSFAQPLLAGVRSSGALNFWQVIYEAEGLTVDLRFAHRTQSKAVYLVGQVFDKQAVRALQNKASVELSTEREELLATTNISALGEFFIEFEPNDNLWLSVKAAGRNAVRIPVTNPKQR